MAEFIHHFDGSLIEEHDNRTVIQRPWREGFARYRAPEGDYGVPRPEAGDWRMLRPDGSVGWRGLLGAQPYFDAIPLPIRRLAGHLPRRQWLALDAMRHTRRFARFLCQEMEGGGPNFVLAIWELARAELRSPDERQALAQAMMTMRRTELFERLTGISFAAAHLRALATAPAVVVNAAFIHDLRGLMTTRETLQAVQAMPTLTLPAVQAMRGLPHWLQCPAVARVIAQGVRPEVLFAGLTERIRAAGQADRRRIRQSLSDVSTGEQLLARLTEIDRRLRWAEPFPPPPIPGGGRLRPITEARELEREGKAMRHCVADYENDVRTGDVYFYRWIGAERATVQLSRDRESGGWRLADHLGHGNALPNHATIAAIQAVVAMQLDAEPWTLATYVAGVGYYDAEKIRNRLWPGLRLILRRQPENPHDHKAIEVLTADGMKLGYVPRSVNAVPADLMDGGTPLEATLAAPWGGGWYDIHILLTAAGTRRAAA